MLFNLYLAKNKKPKNLHFEKNKKPMKKTMKKPKTSRCQL